MQKKEIVLCASSAYEKKYYLNPQFAKLPKQIQDELKIMCVLFTEDVGGILSLVFDEDGTLLFRCQAADNDMSYDDIGSDLKIKQIREQKKELLESLELFYKVFFLHENAADLLMEDND